MTFEKSELVFYPKHGVGKILEIKSIGKGQEEYSSYVVEFETSKEKIFLPVSQASRLGLRKLSSPKEVRETLKILGTFPSCCAREAWKELKKDLEQLFVKGGLASLGSLVRILFERNRFRPLGTREHQLYDLSYAFLIDEMSVVLQTSKPSVEHEIALRVQSSLEKNPESFNLQDKPLLQKEER